MKVVAFFLLAVSLCAAADPGASVTIYRPHDLYWGVGEPVMVDGARLAEFDANTYLVLSLPPGPHTIAWSWPRATPLALNVIADSEVFVRVGVRYKGASSHQCCIEQVDGAQARVEMAKARPVRPAKVTAANLVAEFSTKVGN